MADLIAQGPQPTNRWRRHLPANRPVVLGRTAEGWAASWDSLISGSHAELTFANNQLSVKKLPNARNAIFVRGKEAQAFEIASGEHFVIGETTFLLTEEEVNVSDDVPQPVEEHAYNSKDLQKLRFRNADQRLDVLCRLPEVISGAANDHELFMRLVNMLLSGVMRADAAAIVAMDPRAIHSERPVQILHWDRRIGIGGDFQPSQKLILEAIQRRRQSVLHVWSGAPASAQAFTMNENFDWAFCTPVLGVGCEGWGFYLAGRFATTSMSATPPSNPTDLRDDVKFTELMAAILASLRQINRLQQRQAALSQFFSPVVMGSLEAADPDQMLAPRETEVSVLFCDLRGFSRESERSSDDLMGLLQRVSQALGVMTHHILEQSGVIGDFQGDAAMGFWGWPIPDEDSIERACLAALGIRNTFEAASHDPEHPLAGFRMGIGIATGKAVAGKIGTSDQGKVTVFGPVVNLASRLEGMTKILRAPILLDETTANRVRENLPSDRARCRRLGKFKPYGLDHSLIVTELLPPEAEYPQLSDEQVQTYESAVDALINGRWAEAFQLLHRVPPDDLVKDFLTIYIAQHNRTPPPDWNGVIPLSSKS